MPSKPRFFSLLVVIILVCVSDGSADQIVRFDAPATVECHEVTTEEFYQRYPAEKLIQLNFYIAAEIEASRREQIVELVFRVAGLTSRNMIVDFAPRNVLETDIDGVIAIEKHDEKNASIGLDVSFAHESLVKAGANANRGVKSSETLRYSKLPEHTPIVSSGFLNRGTGVFFKLFPSNVATLEGTHPISITLQVPIDWRADLLMIDCQAKKKSDPLFSGESAKQVVRTQFITPIFLAGDGSAKAMATNYHRREADFRATASQYHKHMSNRDLIGRLRVIGTDYTKIDQKWVYRQLVARGVEKPKLPRGQSSNGLIEALKEFQIAKTEIRNLNR